jgi:hypothetical protein
MHVKYGTIYAQALRQRLMQQQQRAQGHKQTNRMQSINQQREYSHA